MAGAVSRRRFVQWAGGLAAVAVVEGNPLARAVAAAAGRSVAFIGAPTRTARIVRAADQLDVLVELYDANVVGNDVVPSGPGAIARFVFGPQHQAERHFAASAAVPTTAASNMAAGTSVVVVAIPSSTPYSLDGLLDLAESASGVVGQSTSGAPDGTKTALELPAGLITSPATGTRMRAPRTPRTVGSVTEVWVARLERGAGTKPANVYAVDNLLDTDPVSRIPTADEREAIVINSTTIAPITASQLWLTSAGAFANLRGEWPAAATLSRYRHRISGGRDLHVETVTTGFLLPFGHRAAVVVVSEREWTTDSGGGTVAAVRLRRYLDVIEPSVQANRTGEPDKGRGSPFTTIVATADDSVPITLSTVTDSTGVIPGASLIEVDGNDLLVDYTATDRDGATVTFSLPATFLGQANAFGTSATSPAGRLRTWMNANARKGRRSVDLGGQQVAFADPLVVGVGATSRAAFDVQWEWLAPFNKTQAELTTAGSPSTYARVKRATIIDPAIGAFGGSPNTPFPVTLHPRWLASGKGSENFDQAYLKLVTKSTSVIGGDTAVRGVVALELVAEVLNQTTGAGLDLPTATTPWDPAKAMGAGAKIIGGITLEDILEAVPIGDAVPGVDIPFVDVEVDENTITTTFTYEPPVRTNETLGFITNAGSHARVLVTSTVAIDGTSEPEIVTEVCLFDVTLRFLPGGSDPLVDVNFDRICAVLSSGGAFEVHSDVAGITVYGDLGFMMDLFDGVGLSDPVFEIDDDGIDLGVTVNLPDVALGVLELSGINITLFLHLPFDDEAGQLAIDVGTKSEPLQLSVLSFGGTFHAGWDMRFGNGAGGDTIVVGMSVFWEMIKIDVIIAKITVTLRLAADMRLQGSDIVFTGTVSIEGYVSLCGFVEVSLTAAISLTYRSAAEEMVLKGTLYWAVDTFLGGVDGKIQLGQTTIDVSSGGSSLSASASPRAIGAASSGGSFGDVYTSPMWADYCDAFA